MPDFKSKPGSFLPFLEDSQRKELFPQSAPQSPLTLLEILARQTQLSLPLFDLQALGQLGAGYLVIEGEAPEQTVRLTGSGADVVRIARPS